MSDAPRELRATRRRSAAAWSGTIAEPQAPADAVEAPLVAEPSDATAARPGSQHIPRLLVLSGEGDRDASARGPGGAHRFGIAPTPVIGASLTLLGLPAVAASCRPWKRSRARESVSFSPDSPRGVRTRLRSARFPKV